MSELVASFEGSSALACAGAGGSAPRRRRGGAFANVDRARELLGWTARASLDQAIGSALAWAAKLREVLDYE